MVRLTAVGRPATNGLLLLGALAFATMVSCVDEADRISRTKEMVLRQDLFTLREQIDNYTADKNEAPKSLEDLIVAGYLNRIPRDPFTGSEKTWITENELSVDKNGQIEAGITDVHSGSNLTAIDGSAYSSW